jgi:hypothetical protein
MFRELEKRGKWAAVWRWHQMAAKGMKHYVLVQKV